MCICDLNLKEHTSCNTVLYKRFSFLLKYFIFVGYEFLELLYESFSPLLKNFIFVGYEFSELDCRYTLSLHCPTINIFFLSTQ